MKRLLLAILVGAIFAACSRGQETKQFGERIDASAPNVSLADLFARPDDYDGKSVVIDGQYNGLCADGDGDFYFKDKFEMIEADPPAKELNNLAKGTRLRLYGTVKVHHMAAIEPSEKKEAGERGEQPPQVSIRVAAKGAEVLQ